MIITYCLKSIKNLNSHCIVYYLYERYLNTSLYEEFLTAYNAAYMEAGSNPPPPPPQV